jgi:hypothetical protein
VSLANSENVYLKNKAYDTWEHLDNPHSLYNDAYHTHNVQAYDNASFLYGKP